MSGHWTQPADPAVYRPSAGLTIQERAAEQDAAAGGRAFRLINRDDGRTVAVSVALRCFPKSRRVYAYLRWSVSSRGTAEKYLGDVSDCPNREAVLRTAWRRAVALAADASSRSLTAQT